ncbi:MAG: 3-hydroxyacyl-CoA dehydrogenase NAD-binding domain-containing protein [Ferruginibacter sp.]
MRKIIGIAGAGTMGNGIALSAALAGNNVNLYDMASEYLEKAKGAVKSNLDYLVGKSKMSQSESDETLSRINFTDKLNDCVGEIIIEAIVEKLEVKQSLFSQLALINKPDSIFASNTSSLSISKIQEGILNEERVAGLHFFNPAQVMKLVEVVKGNKTSDKTIKELCEFAISLGKTPVVCTDSPGFIVNRVARHFYLEAMHIVESGEATFEEVDEILEASGFKMGPFKLMDMIGMDINLAVSQSLYEAFDNAIRFKPSQLQIEKVKISELGRKTGKGFYNYHTSKL